MCFHRHGIFAVMSLALVSTGADSRCLLVAGARGSRCFALHSGEFDLSWTHSVERTPWRETYRIEGDEIVLIASEFSSAGAGLPDRLRPGEVFRCKDGTMRIERRRLPIPELRIRLSDLSHHVLHAGRRNIDLNTLFGEGIVSLAVRRGERQ
jgi:hypothetical protein